jgi:hypothetical protein
LSWCPTYKAGSTTWKDYFVKRFVDPDISNPDLTKLWKFKLMVSEIFSAISFDNLPFA